jgi:hypothetical protein
MSLDPLDLLESLASQDQYTPQDRYHDFVRVFGTDEGRRVLREILSWGRMFRPGTLGAPIDPHLMAMREGERNMALRLLATLHSEPSQRPTRARSKQ